MSDEVAKPMRQYERQLNELIGQMHVQETVLLITLKKTFEPHRNTLAMLRDLREEVVDKVSRINAISGDAQDTQRLRGTHTLIAEQFFRALKNIFKRYSLLEVP